jgi:hypothetical protein
MKKHSIVKSSPRLIAFFAVCVFSICTNAVLAIPSNPEAGVKGVFGPVVNWPVVPIHLTLLPDGRVLSFGRGLRVAGVMAHDIWNPALGTEALAHTISPYTVTTDIFCAGQTVIPSTGETLITGGTATINKISNYSVADTNLYNPQTSQLQSGTPMAFKRWYPTL